MNDSFAINIIKGGRLKGEVHDIPLHNMNRRVCFVQAIGPIYTMAEINPASMVIITRALNILLLSFSLKDTFPPSYFQNVGIAPGSLLAVDV